MAVVYLHRKKHNNEIYYVGMGNHESRAREIRGRSEYWTRVFNKYDRNIEIVAKDISLEDARELEMFLIEEIGLDNLCNHTLGGEGFFGVKHTQEAKEKMRKANIGKKLSECTKKKISEKLKGHPNYLKKQTKEAREKISIATKGRKVKDKAKKIISKKHKQNNHKPTEKALKLATKSRREKGLMAIEITTGIKFPLWDVENYFNVNKRTVYSNIKHNNPIRSGKGKGLNFTKI
jgi:hypothetical protein